VFIVSFKKLSVSRATDTINIRKVHHIPKPSKRDVIGSWLINRKHKTTDWLISLLSDLWPDQCTNDRQSNLTLRRPDTSVPWSTLSRKSAPIIFILNNSGHEGRQVRESVLCRYIDIAWLDPVATNSTAQHQWRISSAALHNCHNCAHYPIFRRLDPFCFFGWNLLSWTQWTEFIAEIIASIWVAFT
jgi:hypothetical protein